MDDMWPLTPVQADGLACVVCGEEFLTSRSQHVPVGRSETGSQVFACQEHCYATVQDARAFAQATRSASGAASSREAVAGGDSQFWRLLRDLRALGGTEALLTVADDLGSIRDLLKLTIRHASTAADRARWILGNIQPAEPPESEPGDTE
ncbi:hypothetical protein [Streptomyces cacaoi]|uniref:hypothetical protein n=1 Tax=Streptomyces cacaoi TaxID=1898 RepID=UPI0026031D95|nr:hypothetical protein [Streptomyces cacaoi]